MENLLRVARSESAAGTAFAAVADDGSPPEIVSVPAAGAPEGLAPDALAELVGQAAADPEFRHARVFVRSVQLGQPLTLAVAPLRDGVGRSMIGVVAGPEHRFEPTQLAVLERLAQRLLRHLQVVERLSIDGPPDAAVRQRGGTRPDERTRDERAQAERARDEPAQAEPAQAAQARDEPAQRTAPSPAFAQGAPENAPALWWAEPDPLTGLSNLGQFFSRAGKMLVAGERENGALALVVVEVSDSRTAPSAAQALRAQLRFSDPLARVDCDLLAVAIVLVPGGAGDELERRLATAVRSALLRPGSVRTVRVVAEQGDPREVDELLRKAVSRLRDPS